MPEFLTDDIDFAAYLQETDAQTKVRPASDFVEEAQSKLRSRISEKRVFLPWEKCNPSFEFRGGEVTAWVGQNGHGKTDITTLVALSLCGQNEKICVASFEMKPVTTLGRMVRMYSRDNQFHDAYRTPAALETLDQIYAEFGEWSDGRMWLYDQTGTAKPEVVLGMVKYCAKELGITHIFIDSLMKCVKAEDDYNGQKEFVDQLTAIAKDYNVHIHLIHHMKKPSKEGDMPDKHDTKGSGAITDQIDNLFMVWRNKPKEDAFKTLGDASNKKDEPDGYLLCKKQRNYEGSGEGEPVIGLWRERESGQFVANAYDPPLFLKWYPHSENA